MSDIRKDKGTPGTKIPARKSAAGLPQLDTDRLALRSVRLGDAQSIQELAGDRAIAENTLLIPHPYEEGMAEQWIKAQRKRYGEGSEVAYAIVPRGEKSLIGIVGLMITQKHSRGELGYWIGRPYWGLGYATEAAAAVLRYGFEHLRLNRICAFHFARNPASGRILEKIGMKREGISRQHILKWGKFEDVVRYGILRTEFESAGR
jgi:RimJ/RimL family protein N-acetyltransferase